MIPALFSVMLLASGADAAVATTAPTTETAEAPKAERQICKREPIPSSQYRTKRVCLTAAEWKTRKDGHDWTGEVSTKGRAN